MADVAPDIWDRIEDYLVAEGLELDDLLIAGGSGAPTLRVVIDGPDGVDVDHLADLSRGVERLLTDTAFDASVYGLEVTSPGLERSLRRPRHWEKSVGRRVTVKTQLPIDDARRHTGTLLSAGADDAVVDIDGTERTIPYEFVTSAKTVFVWEKSPKPGARAKEQQR
ncbi:MAG: ribosome maturation factor RimP [Acidimicrobiia bacterium]|nr:MAG: ribosome maturation factor RimP [Acidimicrobiia bacterium]